MPLLLCAAVVVTPFNKLLLLLLLLLLAAMLGPGHHCRKTCSGTYKQKGLSFLAPGPAPHPVPARCTAYAPCTDCVPRCLQRCCIALAPPQLRCRRRRCYDRRRAWHQLLKGGGVQGWQGPLAVALSMPGAIGSCIGGRHSSGVAMQPIHCRSLSPP